MSTTLPIVFRFLRSFLAVFAGYVTSVMVVFALLMLSAMVLFPDSMAKMKAIMQMDPAERQAAIANDPGALTPPAAFLVLSLLVDAIAGFSGGYLTARIAPHSPLVHGMILTGLFVAGCTMQVFAGEGLVPLWVGITRIGLLPAAVLGGAWLVTSRASASSKVN